MKIKILLIFFFLAILSFLLFWQVRDYVYQLSFDLLNKNEAVDDTKLVDELLMSMQSITINQLDEEYKERSNISSPEYSEMFQNASFYLLSPKDIYRRIAGEVCIKDLLSRDEFYRQAIMNKSKLIYWRIDRKILYKIIELRKELEGSGYEKNGFSVNHGFRTPKHNKDVGGASKSRHIKGEAVDMIIYDVDKNGSYTDSDKQIVIDILEEKIIQNEGGIGKYPGTRVVHMDVRGHRARWDSY